MTPFEVFEFTSFTSEMLKFYLKKVFSSKNDGFQLVLKCEIFGAKRKDCMCTRPGRRCFHLIDGVRSACVQSGQMCARRDLFFSPPVLFDARNIRNILEERNYSTISERLVLQFNLKDALFDL